MTKSVNPSQPPRKGPHADSTGDYSVVARLDNAVIDPTEKLSLEVYFVGYGEITSPQISFYPSSGFFDPELSTARYNLGKDETGKAVFGTKETKIDDPIGQTLGLRGIKFDSSEEPTIFFDDPEASSPRVVTATKQKAAPLELKFFIKKEARAGQHYISLVFMYFNGEQWRTSTYKAEFTIRSSFQRNETSLWILGFFVATGSFLAAVLPLWSLI